MAEARTAAKGAPVQTITALPAAYQKGGPKVYIADASKSSAVADLDKAHELAADRSDVLAYRASAWRYLLDNKQALADADAALALDPKNPHALLERGIIRRLSGDPEGARADWMRVVALAGDTPAGDLAKSNLDKLSEKAN